MTTQTQKEITGRHVFMAVSAFFLVVIGANVTLAVYASRSWTGLIVPNAYVASQTFDDDTAKLEQMRAMNVSARVSYEHGAIRAVLASRDGAALSAGDVVITLGRPAHDGEDRSITLACGNGLCSAGAALDPGIWQGTLSAMLPEGAWTVPVRLMVKER